MTLNVILQLYEICPECFMAMGSGTFTILTDVKQSPCIQTRIFKLFLTCALHATRLEINLNYIELYLTGYTLLTVNSLKAVGSREFINKFQKYFICKILCLLFFK